MARVAKTTYISQCPATTLLPQSRLRPLASCPVTRCFLSSHSFAFTHSPKLHRHIQNNAWKTPIIRFLSRYILPLLANQDIPPPKRQSLAPLSLNTTSSSGSKLSNNLAFPELRQFLDLLVAVQGPHSPPSPAPFHFRTSLPCFLFRPRTVSDLVSNRFLWILATRVSAASS